MEKLLMKPSEVAECLGLGRTKTYELIASGQLSTVRIGGVLRVPANSVRRWIETNARPGRTAPTRGGVAGR